MNDVELHLRAGQVADEDHDLVVTPADAGWTWSGLSVVTLESGRTHRFETGGFEVAVLPLEGGFTVGVGDHVVELAGRKSVFDGPSDFAYVGRGEVAEVVAGPAGGRIALPAAIARRHLPFRKGEADDVPVELRGAGHVSRAVRDFCGPNTFEADNLIAVEVITPGGNWSSYPPHKHDEHGPDEVPLEEIYYFEIAAGGHGPGIAYQRVYGTGERPIDVLAEVGSGDVVLIPHGYHGPSIAAPGYDLYYLNVMAGPGPERVWRVCDDPAHAWVRDTWVGADVDPRLEGRP